MKKLFTVALILFLLPNAVVSASGKTTIIGTSSVASVAEVMTDGEWSEMTNMTGYKDTPVIFCGADEKKADISWRCTSDVGIGVLKLYIYSSICEEGTETAVLKYSSEFQPEKTKLINQRLGSSGWRQVAMYSSSNNGTLVGLSADSGILTANAIKFELMDDCYKSVVDITNAMGTGFIGKIGCYFAFFDGVEEKLTAEPIVQGEKVYLPLRSVSKLFGGEVIWDEASNCAVWKTDSAKYRIPLSGEVYYVDGVEKQLKNKTIDYNDSLMLPLEFFDFEMNLCIYADNNGYVVVSANEIAALMDDEETVNNLAKVFAHN